MWRGRRKFRVGLDGRRGSGWTGGGEDEDVGGEDEVVGVFASFGVRRQQRKRLNSIRQ